MTIIPSQFIYVKVAVFGTVERWSGEAIVQEAGLRNQESARNAH